MDAPDIHHPILYHLISFIQWEPEEIIRWVINIYVFPLDSDYSTEYH